MKVFKNNEFFAGLSIPEPDVRESIESKMPRDFSIDGMDFLKVSNVLFHILWPYYITAAPWNNKRQKYANEHREPITNLLRYSFANALLKYQLIRDIHEKDGLDIRQNIYVRNTR